MKTQILTILLIATFSLFYGNGMANEPKSTELAMNEIAADDLSEDLVIEDWMVDDEVWHVTESVLPDDTLASTDDNIDIEDWMTNDAVWKIDGTEVN